MNGTIANQFSKRAFGKPLREAVQEEFRKQAVNKTSVPLAKRIIDHWFVGKSEEFRITKEETLELLSPKSQLGTAFRVGFGGTLSDRPLELTKEWHDAVTRSESGETVPFNGVVGWLIEDGAMANVEIEYKGTVKNGIWRGVVQIRDRFDMDPNWKWRPTETRRKRSELGEWRTRAGFIAGQFGHDFEIKSEWTEAQTLD